MRHVATDVLIVGAGPAGAAAARVLASRGIDVLLVDRSEFPRDKVCGDGLIPDALAALGRLGIDGDALAGSRRSEAVRIHAPGGAYISVPIELRCLPRKRFDASMRAAAAAAGAAFLAPYELAGALEDGATVTGATFVHRDGGEALTVRASCTLVATGAAAKPLELFSVCERRQPSAVAARVYVRAPHALSEATRHFVIAYDRHICPGYGWIFPGPDDVFNVGVAYFTDSRRAPPTTNLRVLLRRFAETFAPARELMAVSQPLGDVRGAPLRTALAGSTLARPGLLVIGEACGATYSFTGEGIGKAIESGMLAAEILADRHGAPRRAREAVARAYAATLRERFAERFRAYRLAQDWLAYPFVHDVLAWRGNTGRYVAEQVRAMLLETTDPRALFSLAGALKALVR
jgi:geranylgeranyl reductase family protein